MGQTISANLENGLQFYSKATRYDYPGFYVPLKICSEKNLVGKTKKWVVEEHAGFHSKVGRDGRIYVPRGVVEAKNLKDGNIVELTGAFGKRFCVLHSRKKKNSVEYFCIFDKFLADQTIIFVVEKTKLPRISSFWKNVLNGFTLAKSHEALIVFDGKKQPVLLCTDVPLSDLVHYLGAFFADGTKRGNSWAICASTFQQAGYYLKMHKLMFPKSELRLTLSYTAATESEEGIERLKTEWGRRGMQPHAVRVHQTKTERSENRNVNGTLIIKENRLLVLKLYNRLTAILIRLILRRNDSALARKFLCGVIEGDGNPGGISHGHVTITTNERDAKILKEIAGVSRLKFKVHSDGKNKVSMRIGAISLFEDLEELGYELFKYYPKRRKKLIRRLASTGIGRFFLGKQKKITSWIKARLRNHRLMDKNYQLTRKGKKVQKLFIHMAAKLAK
ncbi:MAG: hypothetical protein ACE5DI_00405 [Candidatus Micrarchaeia archaeon]